jgi:hypothetical protein
MSKKYVPSFLKGSMTNSFAALDDSKEDVCKEESKPLVNTSLPAKQAPVLAPATLASLTSNGSVPRPFVFSPPGLEIKAPILKQESIKKKPFEATDFPALGSKKPTSIALVQKTSFSELSKEWAKKQKEDEAIQKEEKEKEAVTLRTLNKQRMDEENARRMGIIHVPAHLLCKKLDPEEEAMRKKEMEDYNSDEEESLFESVRAQYVEEESEDEYECDGNWNQRKHRDELY